MLLLYSAPAYILHSFLFLLLSSPYFSRLFLITKKIIFNFCTFNFAMVSYHDAVAFYVTSINFA